MDLQDLIKKVNDIEKKLCCILGASSSLPKYELNVETPIATWVDDKTVYRKVIEVTSGGPLNPFGTTLNLGANYVDNILSVSFSGIRTGGITTSLSAGVVLNKATGVLTPTFASGFNSGDIIKIVIEYTKQ